MRHTSRNFPQLPASSAPLTDLQPGGATPVSSSPVAITSEGYMAYTPSGPKPYVVPRERECTNA